MPRLGYLLPTRRIMGGQPETGSLLALAERAETLESTPYGSAIRCWPGRATMR